MWGPVVDSILIWKAHFVAAVVATFLLLRGTKGISVFDKFALGWYVYDALIHIILEGSFLYMSLTGTVVGNNTHPLHFVWKEYSKADKRWGISDPTVVSLEILTVFGCSALCLGLVYAIVKKSPHRHFLQVTLAVMELYGGWMTFCPEWLIGSPSLDTSDPVYLWVYLFFANMIWVVIPAILLWQSWSAMAKAFSGKAKGGSSTAQSPKKKHN